MLDGVAEEAPLAAEAGVGPGRIEPAEMLDGDSDRGLLIGPHGHVAFDRDCPVGAAQLLRQRVELSIERAARTAASLHPRERRAVAAPIPDEAPVIRITGSPSLMLGL